ncbi:anti-sigma B factor antagonist [Motilibacter peucedani]|uniref:Anti-sigma factor antagonist n=1 Tax=Motilibacter peucedani TaxID=598650 RepID=A0A420XQJ7_9ACTN|nr:STAS domain-containing protein [Motilibacter peucedani]RKS75525.1 anti-sigma B factor antagonist [Motilibacter peucedani]
MDPTISSRSEGGVIIVEATGELDTHAAPRLLGTLRDLSTQGRQRVVVDLTGVTFVDSAALGVLIGARKRARLGDGELHLVVTHPHVLRLLHMTGLHKVFDVHGTVDAALAAVQATAADAPAHRSGV